MGIYKSDFINEATARGFVKDCTDTDALDELAAKPPITAYIGFDCTAPSLHAGSLVSIMLLRLFQKCGHKPIVLMGGGTTKVGDPSGKDESRQLLDDAAIAANMAGIKKVFAKYLTFGDGPSDAVMVNNADWLDDLQYIPFLRDYGRLFSVNRMLGFDSVKQRLEREHHLSFLEFNYMILQAYDFVELARRHGCALQMGGSDQWGNIVNGVDLYHRLHGAGDEAAGQDGPAPGMPERLFGLTTELLTTHSGAKMGKTADGAIWLNAEMLSAYDYWQYWRNTEDADVGRFLRLFTELPLDEIARLEALEGVEINDAKKTLADAVTALCHGTEAAAEARNTAEQTFEQGVANDGLPSEDVAKAELEAGIPAFKLLILAGLCTSNGEARRLIRGGGARINDQIIDDETRLVTMDDVVDGVIKVSAGKKRHVLVRPV